MTKGNQSTDTTEIQLRLESSKLGKGRKWNINKVNRILKDTVYIGEYAWGRKRSEDTENNRKPIIVTVPAIIDKDTSLLSR